MALAWVHQTRLDAVPRKATRNNLAPNRGADARVAVDEPRLVLHRRANHERTGGPESPWESCAVLLHA
jgi:hypothetical protein